jgi:hypothetical protein
MDRQRATEWTARERRNGPPESDGMDRQPPRNRYSSGPTRSSNGGWNSAEDPNLRRIPHEQRRLPIFQYKAICGNHKCTYSGINAIFRHNPQAQKDLNSSEKKQFSEMECDQTPVSGRGRTGTFGIFGARSRARTIASRRAARNLPSLVNNHQRTRMSHRRALDRADQFLI